MLTPGDQTDRLGEEVARVLQGAFPTPTKDLARAITFLGVSLFMWLGGSHGELLQAIEEFVSAAGDALPCPRKES
jgi:hypothetical protein